MLAAVLHKSPGALSLEEVLIDEPMPHEVLIRTAATGLCHSDLHFMEWATPGWSPTVLGHEGAGVVEAVGSAVAYVKPGDHVITCLAGFCGECEFCLTGRPNLCANAKEQCHRGPNDPPRLRLADGSPVVQFAGLSAFAEKMLVHEHMVVKIDDDIPLDRAALVGCAVPTGVGAALREARVRPGATVAVIGCGGVGLNVVQGAVIAGARRVIAIDINDGKLKTARLFGATDVINNSAGDALDQVNRLLPGEGGVDYSFEALGLEQTFELAFSLLRSGGTATMLGVSFDTFKIPIHDLLSRSRSIKGCVMGGVQFRQDLPYFLDLYKAGRLKLDELISNRISLEDINEGYAAIAHGAIARSVVVFDY
jgi:S-(hydroxymethyl)glutathione dehydrogenase / alcohol dehydrogenase